MTGEKNEEAAFAPGKATAQEMSLFWGCFLALITTSFAFMGRMSLMGEWSVEFNLDPAQSGRLAGIGIWPFAVSIIFFSFFIDRIGYKTAMVFAFLGHLVWSIMGVSAYFMSQQGNKEGAFQMLYWGSLICGLANGTVEAFINPVVATMFNHNKTKWLNILHAGWPGGLVITGLIIILFDTQFKGTEVAKWYVKIGMIAVPAVLYFLMMIGMKFPQSERVSAGVSYRDMLREFGILGAAVVGFLLTLQLMDFFAVPGQDLPMSQKMIFIGIGTAFVLGFAAYTRSLGNGLLFFLILIMMPLATTEIGTDGWISGIMEDIVKKNGYHATSILIYTSAIMLILRFFAGPIVHAFSPLGLLATSSILAIAGLAFLSQAEGAMILIAATLYGFGKTFFWPTMLGVVSEQTPKGGALTLNAISGIGMLAVGTLGFPYIGTLQSKAEMVAVASNSEVVTSLPGVVADNKIKPEYLKEKKIYEVIPYNIINDDMLKAEIYKVPGEDKQKELTAKISETRGASKQKALLDMAAFPTFMLICYVILLVSFAASGGYKPKVLGQGGH